MKEYYDTDIVEIKKDGILFFDNYFLEFNECKKEWSKRNNISESETTCVAERYGEKGKYYFIFFGKEDVKIEFKVKGLFIDKKRSEKFNLFQMELRKRGYTSFDMT